MINWVLNAIGIVIYFLNRFGNRRTKTKASFKYWFADNYIELFTTLLFDLALMIIVMMPDVQVNFDSFIAENVPFGLTISPIVAKAILSFLLGLGLSSLFYKYYKIRAKLKK
jgi:hypothetical protein